MPILKKRVKFFETDEGVQIEKDLRSMMTDSKYNTESTYSADSITHPDGQITFVDKHKNYLNSHPALNPKTYLANLRLMTKVRK